MGSGLTARDVSVTARVGDFHSGDGEGDRAAAAASEAASGATVAMPLEAWAASLPGTCKGFCFVCFFVLFSGMENCERVCWEGSARKRRELSVE